MPGPRLSKLLRDVWNYKTRTLLVVLSIAVGVFAVGTIADAQAILVQNVETDYAAINPRSAGMATLQLFDDELVHAILHVPGIREAEGVRALAVRSKKPAASDWLGLQIYSVADLPGKGIDKVHLEAGVLVPPERAIVLERASLEYIGARVGDLLQVKSPAGLERHLMIAGVLHDLNAVPPLFSSPLVGYVSPDTLEWLGLARGYNFLVFTVDDPAHARDRAYIQGLATRLRDEIFKPNGIEVNAIEIASAVGRPPLSFALDGMLIMLGALSLLVFLPTGFLVVSTVSALLAQQVRQIGIMKAIGGRTAQIVTLYLGVVLVYGLLALVLPLPLSLAAARGFSEFMGKWLNFDITRFDSPPAVFAAQVALALLVPLLAALYPILAGTRVTVREAISQYGLGKSSFGTSRVDRVLEHVGGLPRPLLLSLRNTVRRKGRLLLTLIPLTLGGMLFIAVLSVRDSLLLSLDELGRFNRNDIQMNFNRLYPVERVESEALAVPGVIRAESWRMDSAVRVRPDGSESGSIQVIAPPPDTTMIEPILERGRWLLPEDENAVVLNTLMFDKEPDLRLGDVIILKIQGRELPWRVAGFVRVQFTLQPMAYVNLSYLSRVLRAPGRANNVRLTTAEHDAAYAMQVMKAVEDHYEEAGMRPYWSQAEEEARGRARQGMMTFVYFLVFLALLLAAVGGLGLVGAMGLNVLERTREIGVLRAIGASNAAIWQIVAVEAILVGLVSSIGGAILALPLSQLLSDQVGLQFFQAPLAFKFAPGGLALWLVFVTLLSMLASLLPAWNAARVPVREALAYE